MDNKSFTEELLNRRLVQVTGFDGLELLQKLVSQDLSPLQAPTGANSGANSGASSAAAYTLLLTPQGKYLFDFFVIKTASGLFLDVPAGQAEALLTALKKYRLRADVDFVFVPNVQLQLHETATAATACHLCFPDPRHADLGYRVWSGEAAALLPDSAARLTRLGIVEPSVEIISGVALPLEYGLQHTRAISFQKGCYLGQELTARMHNRKLAKRVIIAAKAETNQPLITTGTKVQNANSTADVGTVLRVAAPYVLLHVDAVHTDDTVFNLQRQSDTTDGDSTVRLVRC